MTAVSKGLAKRIIPCLDVDKGRVVKGVQFVDIRDAGDPVEVARRYNEQGADEITFLDITASHEDRDTTLHTVERMAGEVFIPLTVGRWGKRVTGYPQPVERRGRQSRYQLGGNPQSRICARGGPAIWLSVHCGGY